MNLNISASDVKVTPGNYRTFELEIECDEKDVVSQLSGKQITDNISHDDLIEYIDIDTCVNHFGTELIGKFTPDEILSEVPIEHFIKSLGEERFKDYIRDIFIDNILDK